LLIAVSPAVNRLGARLHCQGRLPGVACKLFVGNECATIPSDFVGVAEVLWFTRIEPRTAGTCLHLPVCAPLPP
jgi:hypothetical protein